MSMLASDKYNKPHSRIKPNDLLTVKTDKNFWWCVLVLFPFSVILRWQLELELEPLRYYSYSYRILLLQEDPKVL
jgi:hypothetical protein